MKVNKIIILAALLCFTLNVSAQKKNDKILFLEFKFENGKPELTGMTSVKGKLKIRKQKKQNDNGTAVEVLSKKNKILFTDVIENPANAVYEYPGDNGEIKRAEAKSDVQTFFVRVPYCSSIEKVILYDNINSTSLQKNSAAPGGKKFEFKINHGLIKKE